MEVFSGGQKNLPRMRILAPKYNDINFLYTLTCARKMKLFYKLHFLEFP